MENRLNEIESEIKKRLDDFSKKTLGYGKKNFNTDLTKEIKKIIGTYGESLGFKVKAGGNNNFGQEWLYDIVWYSEKEIGLNNIKGLSSTELVLESELGRGLGVIKEDFEKLFLSNSKMKILICFSYTKSRGIDEIKEYCTKAVINYTLLEEGSRILVLIWDDYNSGEFIPHLIIK